MACATAVYTAHSPQPMSTAAHLAASEAARDLGRRPAGLLRLPALRFVLNPGYSSSLASCKNTSLVSLCPNAGT